MLMVLWNKKLLTMVCLKETIISIDPSFCLDHSSLVLKSTDQPGLATTKPFLANSKAQLMNY